eukprot:TRINITY_DN7431_c0_g1_i1.p1 TRINITY_DN7431_c0_g1~~TRINITY_DN7431_c0_g1_i1.p1  ORF type:complete len:63 (-),score=7.47 TRINITY_DN7431_c0_g1_i1:118-306(-)
MVCWVWGVNIEFINFDITLPTHYHPNSKPSTCEIPKVLGRLTCIIMCVGRHNLEKTFFYKTS